MLFFAFLVWYDLTFSMDVIQGYSVNEKSASKRLLVASQGSEFKNEIINQLVDHYKDQDVYMEVIDVTSLDGYSADDWDAVFICYVFEIWAPQPDVKNFLDRQQSTGSIFLFSTSGSGDEKIDGVDGICGASITDEIPQRVAEIIEGIDQILTPH